MCVCVCVYVRWGGGGGKECWGVDIKGKNLLLAFPSFSSWPSI